MYLLVRGVSTELPTSQRNDAGARCNGRPFVDQSLGYSVFAVTGKGIPEPQARGWSKRFFDKAMQHNEVAGTVTMDKSGANKAAHNRLNAERATPIKVRQVKYLNNIVEQDHRAVNRVTGPMLGFKSFRAAQAVLAGIELMHMMRKGQLNMAGCDSMSIAEQFYTLAAQVRSK